MEPSGDLNRRRCNLKGALGPALPVVPEKRIVLADVQTPCRTAGVALGLHATGGVDLTRLALDDDLRRANLARNLSRFRRAAPELTDRIAEASLEGAELFVGRRGDPALAWQGQLVASAYDPRAEGERLAAQVPQEADLVVALGFGAGHHLAALAKRVSQRLIVFEPEPGLLRAALSANPLPFLGDRNIELVCDEDALVAALQRHYTLGLSVHVLPHPSLARSRPEALRSIVERIARAKEQIDVSIATLRTWSQHWALTAVQNAPRMIGLPSLAPLRGALAGTTAVVCAAGPSLAKQLPQLAAARERVVVLGIGQSAAALARAGVRADLVVVTETQDVSHQLEAAPDLGDQNLVLVPQSHPSLFSLPVRRRFLAFERGQPFSCWLGEAMGLGAELRSGGSVAVSAVFLAAFLGAERVLLIGQDLAFTGGRRYSAGTVYDELGVETEPDGSVFFTGLKSKGDLFRRTTPDRELAPGTVWVEDWEGRPILTDQTYASFREEYRAVGQMLRDEGTELVNCTEGGARIPGLVHEAFAEALAGAAAPACRASELLDAAESDGPRAEGLILRSESRRLRERVRELARSATRALKDLGELVGPRGAVDPARLPRYQRAEKKVRAQLDALPVVLSMMQHELQELTLASRKRGGEPSEAVERSRGLLEGASRAAGGVLELLDRLDAALDKPERLDSEGGLQAHEPLSAGLDEPA